MSSHLGESGNVHSIDVDETAGQLESLPAGRFTHHVGFPSLWHPGDSVTILTSDRQRFRATVLDVSRITSAVLIELR